MADDFRTALRWLRSNPWLTGVVTLTLSLGVGANTAIFSALEAVLSPFRFPHADRTVVIWRGSLDSPGATLLIPPLAEQVDLWRGAGSFEQLEAFTTSDMTLTGHGPARPLSVARISPTLPAFVGAHPLTGRGFLPDDALPAAPPVAMLSYGTWVSMFGKQPVRDLTVTLDGTVYTVVGVMQQRFALPRLDQQQPEILLPSAPSALSGNIAVAARLKRGVTPAQAQAELAGLARGAAEAAGGSRWTGRVLAPGYFTRSLRDALTIVMVAVALLLLICCINVSNLLLSHAHARQRDVAVRAALGAPRSRVLRELLLFSGLLGVLGGVGGLGIAAFGTHAILATRPVNMQVLDRIVLDRGVFAFGLAIAVGSGLISGIVPAARLASPRTLEALKSGARSEASGAFGRRFRLGLVVAQVGVSFAILVGGGLVFKSLERRFMQPVGFDASRVAAVFVQAPSWKFPTADAATALFTEERARLSALPGVAAVSLSSGVPPRVGVFFGKAEVEGVPPRPDAEPTVFFGGTADAAYFSVLGQPIVSGRGFTPEEARTGAPVYVMGQSAARQFFPDGNAVGRHFRLSAQEPWHTIVGVVADVRATGLSGDATQPQLYQPLRELQGSAVLVVRTVGNAAAAVGMLRRAAASVNPDAPVTSVATITSLFRDTMAREAFVMRLITIFAVLAAGLAALGLYGVLRHVVVQRTREIGIRMAIGATGSQVTALIVRSGIVTVAAGLALGIPLAFAGSKLLAGQLFQVGRADPLTYGVTALLLGAVAIAAAYLPARRAAKIHPIEAIRTE